MPITHSHALLTTQVPNAEMIPNDKKDNAPLKEYSVVEKKKVTPSPPHALMSEDITMNEPQSSNIEKENAPPSRAERALQRDEQRQNQAAAPKRGGGGGGIERRKLQQPKTLLKLERRLRRTRKNSGTTNTAEKRGEQMRPSLLAWELAVTSRNKRYATQQHIGEERTKGTPL
jgi:hypothetical protein